MAPLCCGQDLSKTHRLTNIWGRICVFFLGDIWYLSTGKGLLSLLAGGLFRKKHYEGKYGQQKEYDQNRIKIDFGEEIFFQTDVTHLGIYVTERSRSCSVGMLDFNEDFLAGIRMH